MPLYTLHLYPWNGHVVDNSIDKSFQKALHQQIADLHSKTFARDPATIRTEFVFPCGEAHDNGYGGYGYVPGKGLFGSKKLSDYIVVQMEFSGSAKEWQAYCRRLVNLPGLSGRSFRSVYLQRNVFEFEVEDVKVAGCVVGVEEGEQLLGYK